MALSDDHKKRIERICKMLEKTLEMADVDDLPIDLRALDTIEIALSLLTQQIEMGLEYFDRPPSDDDDAAPSPGDSDEVDLTMPPDEADKIIEMVKNSQATSFSDADFKFLQKDTGETDSPSVEELNDWFNNPSFGEA